MAIVKRLVKGSALTHGELDENFTDLDTRVSAADAQILTNTTGIAAINGSDPVQAAGKHYVADGAGGGAWEYDPCGWGHYKDNASAQAIGTSPVLLTINALGSTTEEAFLPREIRGSGTLWDSATSAVQPIALGDSFTLRIDLPVTSESGNPSEIILELDIGDIITADVIVEQVIPAGKSVPYVVSVSIPVFVGSTFLANGMRVFLHTNAGTVNILHPAITIVRTSGN